MSTPLGLMAESGEQNRPNTQPASWREQGPVRLLAIGQPSGLPALPDQGPLLRVAQRGRWHP